MADGNVKSVDIQIAPADFETLKSSGYQLCFAKKVNNTYNVVWQSGIDYLVDNTFSWQPMYEMFGSNQFTGDVKVNVSTNKVSIGLGDQAVLDTNGYLGDATSGGPATGITMINNYGTIHPGLCAFSTDYNGKSSTTPIYVAEQPIVSGQDTLTPVEAVQVWFEQDIATSTMFSTARSNAVEVDLTLQNTATRLYKDGKWSTPSASARYADPRTIVVIVATLTAAVIAHDLATKITSKLTGVYKDIKVDVQAPGGTTVKIEYREQSGLPGPRHAQTQMLLANKTTVDTLTEFALESLASLGVGYLTMTANSN
ncbi:hypothetical protein [Amycolatopsis sp. 195334CR]|uniref:hypothetical protein n=1 Tax=Amycolatopsis sp. 195334CR TaxID=2814588 RepID=UPI001A8D963C|nr:hypothetical protein [Amycolatopsis sp. 195334CR]MBN6038900.1 hypothetical protein [Amycolatopsis sp. 195334CR]